MTRIFVAVLLPLLCSACVRERPSVPQFMQISQEILEFAEQDARASQPGRANDGPLYVSVRSFHAAAEKATGESIPEDSVAVALGEPIPAELEQILLCDTGTSLMGCWVRQYGVFVNFNIVRLAGSELRAWVRTSSTDRRVHPTDFCHRVWRLDYRQEGDSWRLADRTLLRDCVQRA
jgi:hypothetical protein